jgi:hypothetical protein
MPSHGTHAKNRIFRDSTCAGRRRYELERLKILIANISLGTSLPARGYTNTLGFESSWLRDLGELCHASIAAATLTSLSAAI